MALYKIQEVANAGVGVASTTLSVKFAPTQHNSALFIVTASDSFSASSISPGTWTSVSGTNAHNFGKIWVCRDLPAGTRSVTVTFGGSTNSGAQVFEYSGFIGAPTLNNSTVGGNSDSAWVGPFTPTAAPNLAIAYNIANTAITAGPPGALTPLTWVGSRQLSAVVLFAETAVPTNFHWIQPTGFWDVLAVAYQPGVEATAFDETAFQNDAFAFLPGVFQSDSFQSDTFQVVLDAFDMGAFQNDSFQPGVTAGASQNAPAGLASGTGAAADASIIVSPNAGLSSGTGTANQPTASVGPNAGVSSGTGQALAPATSLAPNAGVGTGTGAANAPVPTVGPNAGIGTGTGSAFTPGTTVSGTSGVATGSGVAGSPGATVAPNAGLAAGTGQAFNPTLTLASNANPATATGTGTANNPTASLATSAGSGTGTGAAGGPTSSVSASPATASGTGTAFDPTVTVSGDVTAFAGLASGTGQAFDPTVIAQNGAVTGGHPGRPKNPRYGRQILERMTRVERKTERQIVVEMLAEAGLAVGRGEAFSPAVVTFDYADDEEALEALLIGV